MRTEFLATIAALTTLVGSSHSIDKRNNDYYFRIMSNSTTQTCPTAGATPIGFQKAYIVYHLSSL